MRSNATKMWIPWRAMESGKETNKCTRPTPESIEIPRIHNKSLLYTFLHSVLRERLLYIVLCFYMRDKTIKLKSGVCWCWARAAIAVAKNTLWDKRRAVHSAQCTSHRNVVISALSAHSGKKIAIKMVQTRSESFKIFETLAEFVVSFPPCVCCLSSCCRWRFIYIYIYMCCVATMARPKSKHLNWMSMSSNARTRFASVLWTRAPSATVFGPLCKISERKEQQIKNGPTNNGTQK